MLRKQLKTMALSYINSLCLLFLNVKKYLNNPELQPAVAFCSDEQRECALSISRMQKRRAGRYSK